MDKKDYEIAHELKQRIAEIASLIDIRVFGSRARGGADECSDMDVFLEVETINRELKKKIRDVIWEVGFKHSVYISPLIFTRYELEESPLRASPLVHNITEEGVPV